MRKDYLFAAILKALKNHSVIKMECYILIVNIFKCLKA